MGLKETCKQLKMLLENVSHDLDKSDGGNKAAAQRVRTGTIKLEKVAKLYRKESINAEKSGSFKRKSKPAPAKKASKAAKSKSAAKPAPKAKAKGKSKPASKRQATAKILRKK